jgi:hypothetical protein
MAEAAAGAKIKRLRQRVAKAWTYRTRWDALLRDLYDYVIPYRNAGEYAEAGAQYTDKIFDATAVDAAFRFAGRMQQDVTPPYGEFFKIEAGALYDRVEGDKKKKANEEAELISRTIHAAIATSSYETASHEMYLDLFGGTGAMLILEGDDRHPVRCVSVPIGELAIEAGPYGDIWARHWVKNWPAWQIEEMWPQASRKFSEDLKKAIADEPDKTFCICQSTIWEPKEDRWCLYVFEHTRDAKGQENAGDILFTEKYRTSPWITPRFFVVPGEPYGRGPGMIALPFVKTVNKAREYDLKAAALALFGVWTARDDGVFNASTSRMEPGAIWRVAANGGSLGPTLQKLDVPGKYDLSRFVVEDERQQINLVTFNRRLPSEAGPVRSPTEIIERVRELDIDMSGVFGRLTREIIQPTVERVAEILYNKRVLKTSFSIDQLSIALRVVSPVASAQAAQTAKPVVDWMTLIAQTGGPQSVPLYCRVDEALPDIGRKLGVPEKHIVDQATRDGMKRQMQQQQIDQIMAENAASQPVEPAGPQLNGGAV